jgi:hypothetical protein
VVIIAPGSTTVTQAREVGGDIGERLAFRLNTKDDQANAQKDGSFHPELKVSAGF